MAETLDTAGETARPHRTKGRGDWGLGRMDAEQASGGPGDLGSREDSHGAKEGSSTCGEGEGAAAEASDRNEATADTEEAADAAPEDAATNDNDDDEGPLMATRSDTETPSRKRTSPSGDCRLIQSGRTRMPRAAKRRTARTTTTRRPAETRPVAKKRVTTTTAGAGGPSRATERSRPQQSSQRKTTEHRRNDKIDLDDHDGGGDGVTEESAPINSLVKWEAMFNALAKFKTKHGHFRVCPKDNLPLYNWVRYQCRKKEQKYHDLEILRRRRTRKPPIRAMELRWDERERRLDELGFDWKIYTLDHRIKRNRIRPGRFKVSAKWEAMFSALAKFKKKHGHFRVSPKDDMPLYNWARYQCTKKEQKYRDLETLRRRRTRKPSAGAVELRWDERERRLDELGFDWKHPYAREYADTASEDGATDDDDDDEDDKNSDDERDPVSDGSDDDRGGVATDSDEIKRNCGGGDKVGTEWEAKFQALVRFKAEHGHLRVSPTSDLPLHGWLHSQVTRSKHCVVRNPTQWYERIHRLHELGFDWKLGSGATKEGSQDATEGKGSGVPPCATVAGNTVEATGRTIKGGVDNDEVGGTRTESLARHKPEEDSDTEDDSFPELLHDVVSRADTSNAVAWSARGNFVIVHSSRAFANVILTRYFTQTSFASFARRMRRWGFRHQISGHAGVVYFHELFQKDRPELCRNMTRENSSDCEADAIDAARTARTGGLPEDKWLSNEDRWQAHYGALEENGGGVPDHGQVRGLCRYEGGCNKSASDSYAKMCRAHFTLSYPERARTKEALRNRRYRQRKSERAAAAAAVVIAGGAAVAANGDETVGRTIQDSVEMPPALGVGGGEARLRVAVEKNGGGEPDHGQVRGLCRYEGGCTKSASDSYAKMCRAHFTLSYPERATSMRTKEALRNRRYRQRKSERAASDGKAVWEGNDQAWEAQYGALKKFKAEHGHLLVSFVAHPSLYSWMRYQNKKNQRYLLHNNDDGIGNLRWEERKRRLDGLNFDWELKENGVATERMPNDIVEGNEKIGSDEPRPGELDTSEGRWVQNFQELVEYSRSTGHCEVPFRYASNRRLGYWVNRQRRLYWSKTLERERISHLESLGFRWRLKAARRKFPGRGDALSPVPGGAGVHGSVKSISEEPKESGVAHNSPPLVGATANPGNGSSSGAVGAVGPESFSQAEETTGRADELSAGDVGQTKAQQVEAAPTHLHHLEGQVWVAAPLCDQGQGSVSRNQCATNPLATKPRQHACEHEDCPEFAVCAKRRRASSGGGYIRLCRAHFDLVILPNEGTKGVADGDSRPGIGSEQVQGAEYCEGAVANGVKLSGDATEPKRSRKRKAREDQTLSLL